MAKATRRVDTVILEMDIYEANVLKALLFTCVAGVGPIRKVLTDNPNSILSAIGSVATNGFTLENLGTARYVDVSHAKLEPYFG